MNKSTTEKIDAVIQRHFNKYFKDQFITPQMNEWSALRRSLKKLVDEDSQICDTSKMMIEISKAEYKTYGFPYVFLSYNHFSKCWSVTWRNPIDFQNNDINKLGKTPKEACENALEFIKNNPEFFKEGVNSEK